MSFSCGTLTHIWTPQVSLSEAQARLEFDPLATSPETLLAAINSLGTKFTASLESFSVAVTIEEEEQVSVVIVSVLVILILSSMMRSPVWVTETPPNAGCGSRG